MKIINEFKARMKAMLGITKLEQQVHDLESEVRIHKDFVVNKMAELKAYTHVDADVGIRSNNTIILTGVYRNRAYVHFYDLGDGEFKALVEQLREMRSHCFIRNIDSPPMFKGMFKI